MRRLKVDDPLDAFAVHGACGLWALIATGLFATKEYSYAPNSESDEYIKNGIDSGLFMSGSRGLLFGTQVCGALIIISWVVTLCLCMFVPLKWSGFFRVPLYQEDVGADVSKHGGSAYVYPSGEGMRTSQSPERLSGTTMTTKEVKVHPSGRDSGVKYTIDD